MPDFLAWVLRITVIIGIPVVLSLTNVRLLMTHAFPEIIYRLPGFPADFYGFALDDRLRWSKLSIDYILSDPAAGDLAEWRFPDGQQAPPESHFHYTTRDPSFFYNDREVSHMVDVRNVTTGALQVWAVSSVILAVTIGLLALWGPEGSLRSSLIVGSLLTIVLYVGLVAFTAINFQALFTQFHEIFFADGTWTFLWSDSLIRLFPLPFWASAFAYVGLGGLAQAGLIAAGAHYLFRS
jgi:integral membrane protein (TIGR01906 family)